MKRSEAYTLFVGLLLLPLACRHAETDLSAGPQEGPSLAGRMYVLRNVAGQRLPAILVDNEYANVVALADTVCLRDGP